MFNGHSEEFQRRVGELIMAGRMCEPDEIADAMQVPVSCFFEDVDKADTEGKVSASPLDQDDAIPANLFNGKEAIELLNCYYRWPEEQRRRLFELTKSLTKESFAEAA